MSDLQRIQNDINRARQRIAEMEGGQRGIPSAGSMHQNPGRAFEAQIHAQRQALERFELEYVQAMIAEHRWPASVVIERMQAPAAAPAQPTLQLGDATRARLSVLLEDNPGAFIPRSKLKEILQK